ncbi:uncharacterized protein LOC142157916 [Mixophyes fleayi]|uniref:uncharacterized protein LOC142157916 n=1 Tax=Mixophyes fleayi TaxID=3061075 RepID=UPI003F4DF8BA
MDSYLGVLVAVTLGTVVSSAPLPQDLRDTNLSQLVSEAVDIYNRESSSDFAVKLFKDEYEIQLGLNGHKEAKFTVKETICEKSDNRTLESCEFKTEELEKSCLATANDQGNTFSVVCSTVNDGTNAELGSGDMEISSNLEEDYSSQKEDESVFQEHSVIITKESYKETFVEPDDDAERRLIEEFLLPKTGIEKSDDKQLEPKTVKKKLLRGQFLGRLLCIECVFEILPKK